MSQDPAVKKGFAYIEKVTRKQSFSLAVQAFYLEEAMRIVAREKDEHAREETSRRILAEQERFKKILIGLSEKIDKEICLHKDDFRSESDWIRNQSYQGFSLSIAFILSECEKELEAGKK